jgi:Na+/glutamate symporter
MSPPQPQVRARELGRVKDFPGGNLASSASRIAFLQSLCKLPKYLHLVNLVEPLVGAFFTRVIGCIYLIFF